MPLTYASHSRFFLFAGNNPPSSPSHNYIPIAIFNGNSTPTLLHVGSIFPTQLTLSRPSIRPWDADMRKFLSRSQIKP
jgi:hypothetical protein